MQAATGIYTITACYVRMEDSVFIPLQLVEMGVVYTLTKEQLLAGVLQEAVKRNTEVMHAYSDIVAVVAERDGSLRAVRLDPSMDLCTVVGAGVAVTILPIPKLSLPISEPTGASTAVLTLASSETLHR